MEETKQIIENKDPDSLEWGTPAKGGAHKVYGDILNSPRDMGIKVERKKLLNKLASGEIDFNKYNEEVNKIV